MIPIRDHNPIRSRPDVVYIIVALNALVWLGEVFVQWTMGEPALQLFIARHGVVPAYLVSGSAIGSFVTPLTSMFMHGGWLHVIGNMWFLWVFGDNVEDVLGKGRFVLFYLACGLVAVAAQVAIDPSSQVPMVGASGAIAGVLAGYVMLHPRSRVTTLVPVFFILFIELPAWVFIFVWFGMQLLEGVISLGQVGQHVGGTAFFAHIGGFVAGIVLIKLFAVSSEGRRRPSNTGGETPRPRT